MAAWVANDLQLGLIALAALAVACVWVYNKWQELRQRRQADALFAASHGDPLAAAIDAAGEGRDAGLRIEPVIGGAEPVQDEQASAAPPLELADAAIDCLVRFELRQSMAAPSFWQAQRSALDGLDAYECSLRWLAWDEGRWRLLDRHDAGTAQVLVAALQLADRSGPLGEEALAKLLAGLGQLAASLGLSVELPDAEAVLAQARELDAFCASVDWLISLNLVGPAGGGLEGAALARLIEAAGLEPRQEGVMQAMDEEGRSQFILTGLSGSPLALDEALAGVSLSIDVPLVADGVAAFLRLITFARAVVAQTPAKLVDEARKPLRDEAIAAISAKIAEFQEKMRVRDIPAGGRRAMRLYA